MNLRIDFGYFAIDSWAFLLLTLCGFSFLIWSAWRSSYRYYTDQVIRKHLIESGKANLKCMNLEDFEDIRIYSEKAEKHLREAQRLVNYAYPHLGDEFISKLMQETQTHTVEPSMQFVVKNYLNKRK